MDQELIRKAAEAMWLEGTFADLGQRPSIPFDALHPNRKGRYLREAEIALKVFYEHTRGQERERAMRICPDCNTPMKPTGASLTFSTCPNCGKTQ